MVRAVLYLAFRHGDAAFLLTLFVIVDLAFVNMIKRLCMIYLQTERRSHLCPSLYQLESPVTGLQKRSSRPTMAAM